MPETAARLDFGALLPGVGVFGGVRRFLEIGNALVRRGHRYTLYHSDGAAPAWLPFAGETRPLDALGGQAHDVLLCGEPTLLERFAAVPAGLKLFYCVLEGLPNERRIVRDRRWVVLANSSGIRDRLWRRYRVRAEDAIGGIDLACFHPSGPARPARPEPFRVLVYGRTSRSRKGTRIAVRGVVRFARSIAGRSPAWAGAVAHPVQLVLFDHVGPGNEVDPRPELAAAGLPVEFHVGLSQAELASLYASCDVFASAERRAGWANTAAEAMACGLPVICTRSGTRDLAVHRETALVLPLRSVYLVTRALQALYRDPDLRARLRTAAARRIAQFDWDRVGARIEAIACARCRP